MPLPIDPGAKKTRKLNAGHASFDSEFCLEWSSEGFDNLIGAFAAGTGLPDILPIFRGVEDTLCAMAETNQPDWYLPAVAHQRLGETETRFVDIVAFTDRPDAALTIFVWDVTTEMQIRGRLMQQRNEMWLLNQRLQLGGRQNDLARHHAENALIDISEQIGLMVAWVDKHMMIRAATPNFATYLQRSLVDTSLFVTIPTLSGLESELHEIAKQHVPAWRIPGFQLQEDRAQLCDLLFLPWAEGDGLYVAARAMSLESNIEQALRQQRNELTLVEHRLEAQTAALKKVRDRLVDLNQEREALINLIANDIRSNLSVIQGYAEWLGIELRPGGQMGAQNAVTVIEESVSRVKSLVEDVQAIQRVEQALSGGRQMTSLDLVSAVGQCIAMWRGAATLQGLAIHFVHEPPPVHFIGDLNLLHEAIGSMLRCAISQARQPSQLELTLSKRRKWLVLQVAYVTARHPASNQKTLSDAMEIQLARSRLVAEGHEGHLAVESTADGVQSIALWLPSDQDAAQVGHINDATDAPGNGRAMQAPPAAAVSDWISAADDTVQIDRRQGRVWVGGQVVNLSDGEYRLLLQLAEQAGNIVSHERLLATIQEPEAAVTMEKLRVLIWRLRKKLGKSAAGVEYLQTMRGFGYILLR